MSYQVLARKWRPRSFAELVGQGHVVRALTHALESNRVHHAFLFTGTRGVGKTTIARILAKSLNCEQGLSAAPCGQCPTCTEIDSGRFVDLIEVDAASRTKVDDTRELLDNVQYAPTRGRYKVYLIDEVHMLSGHSFNALLKTLEEPPPHVKFLLATTDPQKLPVTVLSRCLQFNLKRLPPEQIAVQIEKILTAETVAFERPALALLAQAADGSLRDALSLLDQAIAFGGGSVMEAEVREMLGTLDQGAVEALLAALEKGDADALLATVNRVAEYSPDYDAILKELLLALHRISLAQLAPAALAGHGEEARWSAHANAVAQEDVQLYYQIALLGRRDLALAPDPRTGLEMTLLRMLAFKPGAERSADEARPAPAKETTAAKSAPVQVAEPPAAVTAATPTVARDGSDWAAVVEKLNLTGLVRELAANCAPVSITADAIVLTTEESFLHLASKERVAALKQALGEYYGRDVRLEIRQEKAAVESPAKAKQRENDERQQAAVEAISNDPNVRAIQEQFNGRIRPGSIRPKV